MSMRSAVATCAVTLLIGCAGTVSAPGGGSESGTAHASPQPPSVAEILRRVNERYASASTYSDEGTVRDIMRRPNGETSTTIGKIRTRWRAPDHMLFELTEKDDEFPEDHLAAWTTGKITKGWFLGRVEEHASLDDALGAYQGVSLGLTALVPRWLLSRGCRISLDYTLEGESACGSSTCFVLVSKVGTRSVTLAIDRDTYALRRYRSVSTVVPSADSVKRAAEHAEELSVTERADFLKRVAEPFEVDMTVVYTPVFDASLPADAFDFKPPSKD